MIRGIAWVVGGVLVALLVLALIVPGGLSAEVVVPVLVTTGAGFVAFGWAVMARRRDEEARRRSRELSAAVHAASNDQGGPR